MTRTPKPDTVAELRKMARRFLETAAERAAREASPPCSAYAKLSPVKSAWLWGALSSVRDRAAREGGEVAAVVDALLDTLRSGVKTP